MLINLIVPLVLLSLIHAEEEGFSPIKKDYYHLDDMYSLCPKCEQDIQVFENDYRLVVKKCNEKKCGYYIGSIVKKTAECCNKSFVKYSDMIINTKDPIKYDIHSFCDNIKFDKDSIIIEKKGLCLVSVRGSFFYLIISPSYSIKVKKSYYNLFLKNPLS